MKPFALVALFVVGAAANYGYSQPAVRVSSYGGGQVRSSGYGGSYGGSYGGNVIPITRFNQEIRGSDSSSVEYETGNGIYMSDNTQVVQGRGGSYMNEYGQNVQSGASLVKSGTVSYTSPEGIPINLSWQADENGYRATGAHLPTPPPIPEDIAASLRGLGGYGGYGGSYGGSSVRVGGY